jgi:hypothetical protein
MIPIVSNFVRFRIDSYILFMISVSSQTSPEQVSTESKPSDDDL